MTTDTQITVCGCEIEYDKSGVGHCWVEADAIDCPPSIQEEIAGEIIDGKMDECFDFVASNGIHYRWSPASDESVEDIGGGFSEAADGTVIYSPE